MPLTRRTSHLKCNSKKIILSSDWMESVEDSLHDIIVFSGKGSLDAAVEKTWLAKFDFPAIMVFYAYIFGVAMVMSFADSYGIGANDVANSFSTAVGSRTLTLLQACIIASFTEFGGAVLLGSEVTDTVKNKIVNTSQFQDNPGAFMLGMLCSLFGSSIWDITATNLGFPVSTTHSTIGGIMGFAIASYGPSTVRWGYEDKGFASIVTSWVISPVLAAILASIIFLGTKYIVLNHEPEKAYRIGIFLIPWYFAVTFAIESLFIVWKGSPRLGLENLFGWKIALIVLSVGIGMAILTRILLVPWLRRVIEDNEALKWYHIPVIWCVDYRPQSERAEATDHSSSNSTDKEHDQNLEESDAECSDTSDDPEKNLDKRKTHDSQDDKRVWWHCLSNIYSPIIQKCLAIIEWIAHGHQAIVADYQLEKNEMLHSQAVKYDSKVERLYQSLQVLTSSLASVAHGSNDVANAVGPLSTIYSIYLHGDMPSSKVPVEIWILAYGGAGIVVGLWTLGYKIMRALGNQITFHCPSRGFSMELGSTLTVLVASKIGIPISTTHCITGATVGVGLCNGTLRAVNWTKIFQILLGWVITVPFAGLISGLIFAFTANSPTI